MGNLGRGAFVDAEVARWWLAYLLLVRLGPWWVMPAEEATVSLLDDPHSTGVFVRRRRDRARARPMLILCAGWALVSSRVVDQGGAAFSSLPCSQVGVFAGEDGFQRGSGRLGLLFFPKVSL